MAVCSELCEHLHLQEAGSWSIFPNFHLLMSIKQWLRRSCFDLSIKALQERQFLFRKSELFEDYHCPAHFSSLMPLHG